MYKINIGTPLQMDKNQELMGERTLTMKYNRTLSGDVQVH